MWHKNENDKPMTRLKYASTVICLYHVCHDNDKDRKASLPHQCAIAYKSVEQSHMTITICLRSNFKLTYHKIENLNKYVYLH